MKLLLIGKTSFIAKVFSFYCDANSIDYEACSHLNIPEELGSFSWIINFSLNPRFFSESYSAIIDQDALIVDKIQKVKHVKYVMLSTRRVYGSDNVLYLYSEGDPLDNTRNTHYGRNKICSEEYCRSVLSPDNLLIVRGSNIFGYEIGRRSFTGIAMDGLLKNSEIELDISGKTVRDFLPVHTFVKYLAHLITRECVGVFNVGAGFGLTLEEFCTALISGYGRGRIITASDAVVQDQFILDSQRLISAGGVKTDKTQVITFVGSLGRKLREEGGVRVNV